MSPFYLFRGGILPKGDLFYRFYIGASLSSIFSFHNLFHSLSLFWHIYFYTCPLTSVLMDSRIPSCTWWTQWNSTHRTTLSKGAGFKGAIDQKNLIRCFYEMCRLVRAPLLQLSGFPMKMRTNHLFSLYPHFISSYMQSANYVTTVYSQQQQKAPPICMIWKGTF